jgi:hypothetical protein
VAVRALNEGGSDIFGELIDLINGTGMDAPEEDAPEAARPSAAIRRRR